MADLRPSNVFLAMVLDTVKTQDVTFERYRILIDTWAQIRELEVMACWEKRRTAVPAEKVRAEGVEKVRAEDEKVHVEDAEKVRVEGVEKVHAETPAESVQNGPEKAPRRDPSAIGKESFATRKRNVLAGIEAFRAAGGTMHEVADAAPGLTLTQVQDALDRKALPLTVWTALEKAVKKLEARLPDGPLPGD